MDLLVLSGRPKFGWLTLAGWIAMAIWLVLADRMIFAGYAAGWLTLAGWIAGYRADSGRETLAGYPAS